MAKKSTNKAKENSVAANAEVGGNVGGNLIMGHGNIVNLAPDQISFRSLRQLPPAPADFTGREAELQQILEDFTKNKGAAISGLTGMGGIGKTALGLVAAHEIESKYPAAQIFLDLKGLSEPLSPADVMRHVILSFEPTSDLREFNNDQLAGLYQSILAGKKILLFLDNALDAAQVRLLIPPDTCALIVTSRRSFALPGMDKPIRLDVLPERKAAQLLKRLCKRIMGSANDIAKLCGYIPLALQIAGTFLAVHSDWSPEEYINRLTAQRLKLLKGEDDDPKYNLEAAIGLSYAQLTDDEQKSWRILSIFPASFRRDAAIAMWELDESMVHDLLSKLNRMSLLDYDEKAERYSLHDLLADYALSQMANADAQESRLKHASYYKDVLSAADDLYLQGGEHVLLGLRLFDLEWEHIHAGQAWAVATKSTSKSASILCVTYPDAGAYILSLRQHPRDKIRWLNSAIYAAREIGDRRGEGAALGNLGNAYAALGDARKAIEFYEQALVIDREIGDRRGEGADLGNLGNAYAALGDARKAIEFYEQALVIAREIGDRRGEGNSLGNLGNVYRDLGEPRKAIEYHEQQLVIDHEIGDRYSEGQALGNLGNAYAVLGEVHKAIEFYEQRMIIAREIGDRRGEGAALGNLGSAYFRLEDYSKAASFYNLQVILAQAIGDRHGEGNAYWGIAICEKQSGRLEETRIMFENALRIFKEIESPSAATMQKMLDELAEG